MKHKQIGRFFYYVHDHTGLLDKLTGKRTMVIETDLVDLDFHVEQIITDLIRG